MKKRTFLSLLEQLFMIAVFTVVAAICVKGFFGAHSISKDRQAQDNAVTAAQNAAETVKSVHGDLQKTAELLSGEYENGTVTVYFDEKWNTVSDGSNALYVMCIESIKSDAELLGKAEICVNKKDRQIFSVTVGWQEEYGEG